MFLRLRFPKKVPTSVPTFYVSVRHLIRTHVLFYNKNLLSNSISGETYTYIYIVIFMIHIKLYQQHRQEASREQKALKSRQAVLGRYCVPRCCFR